MSSLLSWILKRCLRVPEECLCQLHHDICLRRSHFLPHFFYPLSLDVTAIKAPTNAWMYFWFDYTRQLLQNRLNRYFQNPDIAQIGPTTTTHPPTGRLIAIFWAEISLFGEMFKICTFQECLQMTEWNYGAGSPQTSSPTTWPPFPQSPTARCKNPMIFVQVVERLYNWESCQCTDKRLSNTLKINRKYAFV